MDRSRITLLNLLVAPTALQSIVIKQIIMKTEGSDHLQTEPIILMILTLSAPATGGGGTYF